MYIVCSYCKEPYSVESGIKGCLRCLEAAKEPAVIPDEKTAEGPRWLRLLGGLWFVLGAGLLLSTPALGAFTLIPSAFFLLIGVAADRARTTRAVWLSGMAVCLPLIFLVLIMIILGVLVSGTFPLR